MKENAVRLIWGLALIFGGLLFLAYNMGWIPQASGMLWVIAFAILSLVFFASFLLQGIKSWGFLFPAFILAGIAIIIYLGEIGITGAFMGTIILWAIAIPFLVPLAISPRENWWAAIPAWALGVIGLIVLGSEIARGEVVGAFVLFSIAAPFLFVYLINRQQWWALIPGFVLGAIGFLILLTTVARGEVIGAFVMFAIAAPFFVVYFRSSENWWALIPAGIVTSVGASILLSIYTGGNGTQKAAFINGVIYLGIAITFALLWMRRAAAPTEWARYPAIVFGIAAVIAFAIGSVSKIVLPVILILFGLWMLTGFRTSIRPAK